MGKTGDVSWLDRQVFCYMDKGCYTDIVLHSVVNMHSCLGLQNNCNAFCLSLDSLKWTTYTDMCHFMTEILGNFRKEYKAW